MEHRCTERVVSDLKILIYKHNLPVAIGRIRNGSKMGLFIETEFADIHCEQQLSLAVLVPKSVLGQSKPDQSKAESIKINALVIHKAKNGFGAALDFENSDMADVFVSLLKAPKCILEDEQIFALAANS